MTGFSRSFSLVGLALFALAPDAAAQQAVVNGGFENPTTASFILVNAGQPTINGWTIGGNSVDVVNGSGSGIGAAFAGSQYIDIDGSGPGTLTQSFATTAGTQYALSFAYANNYTSPTFGTTATVRVFDANGNLLGPTTLTHTTSTAGDLDWTVFSGTFTAGLGATSIELASLSAASSNAGVMFDAVSITPVPEPGLLLGVGAAGAWWLRSRRRTAVAA